MTTRPTIKVTRYIWLQPDKRGLRGIALRRGNQIVGHYTADEARRFADQLHDLADQIDQEDARRPRFQHPDIPVTTPQPPSCTAPGTTTAKVSRSGQRECSLATMPSPKPPASQSKQLKADSSPAC